MSHEKGKVTVLQLNTLLKQADASKRKLTLTRLSSGEAILHDLLIHRQRIRLAFVFIIVLNSSTNPNELSTRLVGGGKQIGLNMIK